jgi:hypothetical protein
MNSTFVIVALSCVVLGAVGNAAIFAYAGARHVATALGFGW